MGGIQCPSDVWRSTQFEIGAVQLRFVTEILPKSPFLYVNRSPIWCDFRGSAKAIQYSVNIALTLQSNLQYGWIKKFAELNLEESEECGFLHICWAGSTRATVNRNITNQDIYWDRFLYNRLGGKRSGGQIKGLTTSFWLSETFLFPLNGSTTFPVAMWKLTTYLITTSKTAPG